MALLLGAHRPRAHQTHLTPQDVENLRQGRQACALQPAGPTKAPLTEDLAINASARRLHHRDLGAQTGEEQKRGQSGQGCARQEKVHQTLEPKALG